jgi:hypothetical protein
LRSPNDGYETRTWIAEARLRLGQRRTEKPATKAGQIRALWPEITTAIAAGQSINNICKWLEEDAGIIMGVTSLTSYISRIRRRENHGVRPQTNLPTATPSASSAAEPQVIREFDPLANVRARQAKRSGFDYHPATAEDAKNLI